MGPEIQWGETLAQLGDRMRRNQVANRRAKLGPSPNTYTIAEIERVLLRRGFTEAEIIEWWHWDDHRMARWYHTQNRWADVHHFARTGELLGDD